MRRFILYFTSFRGKILLFLSVMSFFNLVMGFLSLFESYGLPDAIFFFANAFGYYMVRRYLQL